MAILVILRFASAADPRPIYDAIVDEMGIREKPASGCVYHWAAPVKDGLFVADIWETREQFDAFAREKIEPLARKHGLSAPTTEIADVYKLHGVASAAKGGIGVLVECDGDAKDLLAKYDAANEKMDLPGQPPEGLILHAMTTTSKGIRGVDRWQSRDAFDRFVQTRLGPALQAVGMPPPRIEYFDVYNTIDGRAAT